MFSALLMQQRNRFMKTILSIQSFVSYGHVGNSSVVFPLQRLGYQVWPIHTVQFSNHTGYGEWKGAIFEPEHISEIFLGIKERGVLPQCNAMLTGYMGSAQLGNVMQNILNELNQVNPDLLYCCDPVMGDVGRGFFVKPGIPEYFRDHLVPKAHIITPNQFELEYLSDIKITDLNTAIKASRDMIARGPKIVLITSLMLPDESNEYINMAVVDEKEAYLVKTPLLPLSVNGAGDLTSALFTAFYLPKRDIKFALESCAARIFAILEITHQQGSREIQIIQAQDSLINPPRIFKAEKID